MRNRIRHGENNLVVEVNPSWRVIIVSISDLIIDQQRCVPKISPTLKLMHASTTKPSVGERTSV